MRKTDDQTVRYFRSARMSQSRIRNIFVGSVGLSVLLIVTLGFLPHGSSRLGRLVEFTHPLLLLWSFVMSAYAFWCLWQTADERKKLLHESAVTDPATGLKTLDYVRRLLGAEERRVREERRPTTAIYVDLENLERVNNQFGPTVGNVVLESVAGVIQSLLPADGDVGRVAGDEFIAVLPGLSLGKAQAIAERMEREVADFELDLGRARIINDVRCRTGVVECPGGGASPDQIIILARQAMCG
jgi:diguanylate cyclase (GGDEF)-like protein